MDASDSSKNDSRQRPQPRKRTSAAGSQRATQPHTNTAPTAGGSTRAAGGGRAAGSRSAKNATVIRGGAAARPGSGSGRPSAGGSRPKPKKRSRWRVFWRVTLIVLLLLAVAGGIAGCVVYERLTDDLPDLSAGSEPLAETSIIYDRNGAVLTELHAEQNRTYVPIANIPMALRQAVISTEDQSFYEHKGVDPFGIARALWVNVTQGKHQGGSTITQQYVVNTFIEREDSVTRKLKEAILAYQLESKFTKDEILEKYLNAIYYGHGAYGVSAAAQTYFGKDLAQLTTAECAMIAGVIKSPGNFSPRIDPEAAQTRRDTVLAQMLEQGYIDQATHDAAVAEAITLAAPAPTTTPAPYFVEWVLQQLINDYGADAVYKGGLRVKTTIDLAMQAAAETAIVSVLDRPEDPSAALVAVDPKTGEVRAMVGGKDFNTQQFNAAVQGGRQPGSSFKTFVLASALERGISPEQVYESAAGSFPIPGGQTWNVTGSSAGGPMRLRVATEKSINAVFAQLILAVGAEKVADTAKRMGITTPIKAVPSIALGAQEVTPLEMASAYGTLANGGVHMQPRGITEVSTKAGEILYTAPTTGTEAISAAVAYLTTDMLKGVIASGTGTAAKIGRPAAGKTGTTQEYRDAWFVGYTPDLAAAVWMGHVEGQIEMTDVHGKKVTGGSFPAQIWATFMKAALANTPASEFAQPKGITAATICLDSGQLAGELCPNQGGAIFLSANLPVACELHATPALVDVPNLIGTMKADALATLSSLGLVATVEEKPVPGVPAGMVSDQDPRYGGQVPAGSTIKVIVSTGSPQMEEPIAAFKFTPAAPKTGDEIAFDATGSSDPDGTIVKYAWEFGDGSPLITGAEVTHTFTSAGTYTVTLWVTDDDDLVSSLPLTIEVK
ncbi:MAG: PBP1A family penicillin-binding protein [Coriobacteriia bacterium]|nr:PBP1A family penicillin-binding protein [Coriobacteriia bacterium]